ncbi:MAG TPA: hypothetical protein VFQ61_39515 [Polyangiaceae bacterium]|nr:hypothetical protein [Polyangiaceae bacterium]
MRTLDKYLERHAEAGLSELAEQLGRYHAALVIPALGENPELLRGIASACALASGRVLVVLVLNATPKSAPELREQNDLCFQVWSRGAVQLGPNAYLRPEADFDLLLLDRSSPGFELPLKEGVGLARKYGGDVVCALARLGRLELPIVLYTDGDVRLPEDYFARAARAWRETAGNQAPSAWLFPFTHVPAEDGRVWRATRVYESTLRYHVLGLVRASSPYAYQSLGSTLAIPVDAYAQVRGIPKREAGEDFYVLDKLAKLAPLHRLLGAPIEIRSRRSARVPFGTGSNVTRLSSQDGPALVASPDAFEALGCVIRALDRFARGPTARELEAGLATAPAAWQGAIAHAVAQSGLVPACLDAAAKVGAGDLARRLHTWFDALKTLRFLHHLRDAGLPERTLAEALGAARGWLGATDPEDPCAGLELAERRLPPEVGPTLPRYVTHVTRAL